MPVSDSSVMSAMQGSPASSPVSDTETPPMGSPMSTPEPKQGNIEAAKVKLGTALDVIEQALPDIGSETPEGQKLQQCIRALSSILGPQKGKTGELQNADILNLMQSLPQGVGPQAGAQGGAPPGPGAGAPPAAPPGAPPPM